MGVGVEALQVGSWNKGKSKGKHKIEEGDEIKGCWMKFRFMGRCLSPKTKMDNSTSGTSTQYGIIQSVPLTFVLCYNVYIFLCSNFMVLFGVRCSILILYNVKVLLCLTACLLPPIDICVHRKACHVMCYGL